MPSAKDGFPAVGDTEQALFAAPDASPATRRSIRRAAGCVERIEPLLAQQVHGERQRPEDARKGAMPHVEPACKGSEGRHHQPCAVACEAPSAHSTTTPSHAGDRMEVTGDLALGAGRFVAENQCADRERAAKSAADARGRVGVVISGDPDPIAPALQSRQRRPITRRDAGGPLRS